MYRKSTRRHGVVAGALLFIVAATNALGYSPADCQGLIDPTVIHNVYQESSTQDNQELERLRSSSATQDADSLQVNFAGIGVGFGSSGASANGSASDRQAVSSSTHYVFVSSVVGELAQAYIQCLRVVGRDPLWIKPTITGLESLQVILSAKSLTDNVILQAVSVQPVESPASVDPASAVSQVTCTLPGAQSGSGADIKNKALKLVVGAERPGVAGSGQVILCNRGPVKLGNGNGAVNRYLPVSITLKLNSGATPAFTFKWPGAGLPSIATLESTQSMLNTFASRLARLESAGSYGCTRIDQNKWQLDTAVSCPAGQYLHSLTFHHNHGQNELPNETWSAECCALLGPAIPDTISVH